MTAALVIVLVLKGSAPWWLWALGLLAAVTDIVILVER